MRLQSNVNRKILELVVKMDDSSISYMLILNVHLANFFQMNRKKST